MIIIDGKKVSEEIQNEIAAQVEQIKSSGGKIPHLAAILVGNNPASETYVNGKVKACERVGFKSTLVRLPETVSEDELLETISELNKPFSKVLPNGEDLGGASVDGFIVQLPLPKNISERKVIEAIAPEKDVDGFHPLNVGRMALHLPTYLPATPMGILQLIERYKIPTEGKNCVIVGRSHIVGSPMSILLARKTCPGNCTVTLAHSQTKNLKEICQSADIIIAALGKPQFLTADFVKQGAVVIDVGITRIKSAQTKSGWKLLGDVKFDEVAPKCSYITPVPGGVGPMTIAALLLNALKASKKEIYQ